MTHVLIFCLLFSGFLASSFYMYQILNFYLVFVLVKTLGFLHLYQNFGAIPLNQADFATD